MKRAKPKAVLFDLDGTLVDSAEDLMAALNHVRRELGLQTPAPRAAREFVSAGAVAMMRAGLPETLHDQIASHRQVFLDHYQAHIAVHSQPYPGARELLTRLAQQGIAWGIITNKPEYLAKLLLEALALTPAVLLGGDSLAQKKPHPAPILHACNALGIPAQNTWMVGDDPRDIEAGIAAGCAATIACRYGYLGASPPVEQWGASWIIDGLHELSL